MWTMNPMAIRSYASSGTATAKRLAIEKWHVLIFWMLQGSEANKIWV